MTIRNLLINAAGVAALTIGFSMVSAPAMAQVFGYEDHVEDPVDGFIGPIPTSAPAIIVASDGETPFDPFHAGFDTSDGIVLNDSWAPDPAFAAAFAPGFWTLIPGTSTWVLPASTPCGSENEPACEPIAKWIFTPGSGWLPGTLGLRLFDSDGSLSDLITVANDGPNGAATITFASDPFGIPEPAAWGLMLVGFAGLGAALRAQRKAAVA